MTPHATQYLSIESSTSTTRTRTACLHISKKPAGVYPTMAPHATQYLSTESFSSNKPGRDQHAYTTGRKPAKGPQDDPPKAHIPFHGVLRVHNQDAAGAPAWLRPDERDGPFPWYRALTGGDVIRQFTVTIFCGVR